MNDNENDNFILVHSEDVCNIDSVIVCGPALGHVGAVSLNLEYQSSKSGWYDLLLFLTSEKIKNVAQHFGKTFFEELVHIYLY